MDDLRGRRRSPWAVKGSMPRTLQLSEIDAPGVPRHVLRLPEHRCVRLRVGGHVGADLLVRLLRDRGTTRSRPGTRSAT